MIQHSFVAKQEKNNNKHHGNCCSTTANRFPAKTFHQPLFKLSSQDSNENAKKRQ
jgi:hypothetical protein